MGWAGLLFWCFSDRDRYIDHIDRPVRIGHFDGALVGAWCRVVIAVRVVPGQLSFCGHVLNGRLFPGLKGIGLARFIHITRHIIRQVNGLPGVNFFRSHSRFVELAHGQFVLRIEEGVGVRPLQALVGLAVIRIRCGSIQGPLRRVHKVRLQPRFKEQLLVLLFRNFSQLAADIRLGLAGHERVDNRIGTRLAQRAFKNIVV